MADLITHIIISYVVGKRIVSSNYLLAFIITNIIPDLECIVGFTYAVIQRESFESAVSAALSPPFHPSILHSIFFLPLTILLAVTLSRAIFLLKKQEPKLKYLAYSSFIGILLHIILDLMQTGNIPFWPLMFEAGLNILPYDTPGRVATIMITCIIGLIDFVIQRMKN